MGATQLSTALVTRFVGALMIGGLTASLAPAAVNGASLQPAVQSAREAAATASSGQEGPVLAAGSNASASIPGPLPYIYVGVWDGVRIRLTHVRNVTVEGLADARLLGQVTDFRTNDPYYACLDGRSINVWSAPREFPGKYVVHNGDQGTQCVYGTWTFAPYTFTGIWHGRRISLTHVRNMTVEGLPDARLIGALTDFHTTDPYYACLDGRSLNVWSAPREFPGRDAVHNGDQGTQCVYGTWTFLI